MRKPATHVEQLDITTDQRRDLKGWLASLTGRKCIIVPRVLFEALPRLNSSQIALNLELLTRCTWTGDRAETTASTDLHLSRLAARWGMTARTFHSALKQPGKHLQLVREDTPGRRVRRYGHRYRVIVSRPEADKVDEISGFSRAEMVDEISGVSADKVDEISGSLNDVFTLSPFSYEKVITPSSPADAAKDQDKDIGACQPGRDSQDKDRVTTDEATDALPANPADLLPMDSDPEAQAIIPVPDIDTSPAPTADLLPADSDPEDPVAAAQDLDALPTDTADLLPTDRDSEPEPTPETLPVADPPLPPPDQHNLIPADLRDLARLYVIYLQYVASSYLSRCEASWLTVVNAAVHARRAPNILNRPALFRKIIESGDRRVLDDGRVVSYLTDEDEQAALAWIKEQEPTPVMRDLHVVPKPPALSPDADLVARVQRVLTLEGYKGDLLHGLKRFDEGRNWTRERLNTALAELRTPPEPADPSPAVTLADFPVCSSKLAQIDPSLVPMGFHPPTEETSPEKPTEAATERESTGMVPSTIHQADVPTRLASHISSDDSSAFPPDPDAADVAGSEPWQEGPEATFWDQPWLKLDRIKTPLHGIPITRLRYAIENNLRDDGFIVGLYEEALSMGYMQENEGGPLVFFAAAEHVLYAGGIPDRPGLFYRIIAFGKWDLITSAAEDRARQRIDRMTWSKESPGGSYASS